MTMFNAMKAVFLTSLGMAILYIAVSMIIPLHLQNGDVVVSTLATTTFGMAMIGLMLAAILVIRRFISKLTRSQI